MTIQWPTEGVLKILQIPFVQSWNEPTYFKTSWYEKLFPFLLWEHIQKITFSKIYSQYQIGV